MGDPKRIKEYQGENIIETEGGVDPDKVTKTGTGVIRKGAEDIRLSGTRLKGIDEALFGDDKPKKKKDY